MKKRRFHVLIEQDEGGMFVATVPELPGCHTQGETLEALRANVREAIELYLEDLGDGPSPVRFIGIEQVEVSG